MAFDPTTTASIQNLAPRAVSSLALAAGVYDVRASNTVLVADDAGFTNPTLVFLGQPAEITLAAPTTLFFRAVRAQTLTDIGVSVSGSPSVFDPTTVASIQGLAPQATGSLALAAGVFDIRSTNTVLVADDAGFTNPSIVFLGQPARVTLGAPTTLFFRTIRVVTPTDIGISPATTEDGERLQTQYIELAVDFTTTATPPVYVPLLSLSITTLAESSFLDVMFSTSWRHIGVFAGNVAANVRWRVNGVLQLYGATSNALRAQIQPLPFRRRVPVTAGTHVVLIEIAKFGPVAQTLIIDVATLPDLNHCNLTVTENRS